MTGSARLFVAIGLSSTARAVIGRRCRPLLESPSIRRVREEQMHLTLRFLSRVPRDLVDSLGESLAGAVAELAPFDLRFEGVGCFPNARRPAVLWVGVVEHHALWQTHAAVADAVVSAGLGPETRAFRPHVTIGRVRRGAAMPEGFESALARTHVETGTRVGAISLIESTLSPTGALHREVRRCPFRGES